MSYKFTHPTILLLAFVLGSTLLYAQDESGVKKSTTQSEADASFTHAEQATIERNAKKKEQAAALAAVYQKYLGVSSPHDPQYADKKSMLIEQSPEKYKQMVAEIEAIYGAPAQPKEVKKSELDQLPEEQQRRIKAHPELYRIVD